MTEERLLIGFVCIAAVYALNVIFRVIPQINREVEKIEHDERNRGN